jgi:hypothetical protein
MVRESRWCEQNDAATVVCSADGAVFLVVLSTCTLNRVAQVPAQDSSRVKTGFIRWTPWRHYGVKGSGRRREQTARGDRGSGCNSKSGREKLVGDTGADEVMVVTDTDEHEDRLRSYGRVAEIATVIEAKPIMAVKEGEEWTVRS